MFAGVCRSVGKGRKLMQPYKVAILIRTKNRLPFLRRAVKTLMAQSFQSFKLYIVNDGGDEAGIRQCLEEHGLFYGDRALCVSLPMSTGRGSALSIGLSMAREEYLLIHDDDDTLEPSFLEKTVGFLEKDRSHFFAGVTTSNYDVYEHVEGDEIIIDRRTDQLGGKSGSMIDYSLYLAHACIVMPITLLFRRSAFLSAGNANTMMSYVEDHDLFLRLMRYGEIGIIPEFLCSYHQRPSTGSAYDLSRDEVSYSYEMAYKNSVIRDALNGKSSLKNMQAYFINHNHLDRYYMGQLSQQVGQLQEAFSEMSQLMKAVLTHLSRQ